MKRNIFKLFTNKFLSYPLWVKQVVFYRLWQNMTENNCEKFIINYPDKLFSMHIPTLTFQGKQELCSKNSGLDNNIYNFLKFSHNGYSILESALNMFMSIEEISKLYIFCLEQNYITAPEKDDIYIMAGFISGKFPIGEYFLRIGDITSEDLKLALKEQADIPENKEHKLLGEILVKHGKISEKDLLTLFKLKSDAKKRFVINPEFLPEEESNKNIINKLQKEITILKEENKALKKTMSKIVDTVKNYDI